MEQSETCELFLGGGKQPSHQWLVTWCGTYHKNLAFLQLMWTYVLEVLETISEYRESEQRTKASDLMVRLEHSEFVVIMHLMIGVLGRPYNCHNPYKRKIWILPRKFNSVPRCICSIYLENTFWNVEFFWKIYSHIRHDILCENINFGKKPMFFVCCIKRIQCFTKSLILTPNYVFFTLAP